MHHNQNMRVFMLQGAGGGLYLTWQPGSQVVKRWQEKECSRVVKA